MARAASSPVAERPLPCSASVCGMAPEAVSPFTVDDATDEELVEQDPGIRYARARLGKTFRGDIQGRSTVEMLSVRADSGSAAYVALERIVGSLQGRSGSFALLHLATMSAGEQSGRWLIAPGSGSGELAGISGEGRIETAAGAHTLHLDYKLPESG